MQLVALGFDIGITDNNPIGFAAVAVAGKGLTLERAGVLIPDMKLDYEERIAALHMECWKIIGASQPAMVSFEKAAAHVNIASGLKLAEMGGAVRGAAAFAGLRCYGVQPAEAKKALTQYGGQDKAGMQEKVIQLFGAGVLALVGVDAAHVADAVGVALAGHARHVAYLRKLVAADRAPVKKRKKAA